MRVFETDACCLKCAPNPKACIWNAHQGIIVSLNLYWNHIYIDGLVQDCGISVANALEIPLSCTKPSICLSCAQRCMYLILEATFLSNDAWCWNARQIPKPPSSRKPLPPSFRSQRRGVAKTGIHGWDAHRSTCKTYMYVIRSNVIPFPRCIYYKTHIDMYTRV